MATNGPCGMYRLKNVYNFCENVSLPNCMYKMKNIYNDVNGESKGGEGTDGYQVLERRQENIIRQLEDLKAQVSLLKDSFKFTEEGLQQISSTNLDSGKSHLEFKPKLSQFQDIVINADTSNPPLSVWVLANMLQDSLGVHLATHVHSSVTTLPEEIRRLCGTGLKSYIRSRHSLVLTVIWKKGITEPELMINPILQVAIQGEANIARYLGRLLLKEIPSPEVATEVDIWLDRCISLMTPTSNKSRQTFLKMMNTQLGERGYLTGESLTIADVVCWSILLKTGVTNSLPSNVLKWWKALYSQHPFQLTLQSYQLSLSIF